MKAEHTEEREGHKGESEHVCVRKLQLRQHLLQGTGKRVFSEGAGVGGVGARRGTCCDSDPQTHVFLVVTWCS